MQIAALCVTFRARLALTRPALCGGVRGRGRMKRGVRMMRRKRRLRRKKRMRRGMVMWRGKETGENSVRKRKWIYCIDLMLIY